MQGDQAAHISAQTGTIVFVGHGASRTGAPTSLLNAVRWTAQNKKYECIVLLGNGGPLVAEYAKHASVYLWNTKATPVSYPLPGSALLPSLLRKIGIMAKQANSKHHAEILSAVAKHDVRCIFNNTGVNGAILQALRTVSDAPVVSRIPELEGYMRKNNRNGSVDRILMLTDHFVAVSETVKANLVQRHSVPAERIDVVPGACAAARVRRGDATLRANQGLAEDAFLVGACGTLDYRKGVDLFIQLAHHCVNRLGRRDVHFCWIGACVSHDSCIEYKFEVEHLGLQDHLFFIGQVEETSVAFADLDVFALTSREDPFPLVMLEAARQGLPVVCFQDSGGATEFVDEAIGAAVPMLDIAAFAQAVLALRDTPERRHKLGEAAYQRSLSYTPERMACAIHRVIEQVAQQPVNT